MPDYLSKMIENNWLGQKTKQGFYKKVDKGVIHSLDLETLEYTPMKKNKYDAKYKLKIIDNKFLPNYLVANKQNYKGKVKWR